VEGLRATGCEVASVYVAFGHSLFHFHRPRCRATRAACARGHRVSTRQSRRSGTVQAYSIAGSCTQTAIQTERARRESSSVI